MCKAIGAYYDIKRFCLENQNTNLKVLLYKLPVKYITQRSQTKEFQSSTDKASEIKIAMMKFIHKPKTYLSTKKIVIFNCLYNNNKPVIV